MLDGRKRFRGKLAGVEGDIVRVALDAPADGDDFALVPLAAIAEAKLVLTDELMQGVAPPAQAGGARPDETDKTGAERAADPLNDGSNRKWPSVQTDWNSCRSPTRSRARSRSTA